MFFPVEISKKVQRFLLLGASGGVQREDVSKSVKRKEPSFLKQTFQ